MVSFNTFIDIDVHRSMYVQSTPLYIDHFGHFISGHIKQVLLCPKTTSLLRPLLVIPRVVALGRFHCI